jgi:hypothetical protein
MPLDLCHIDYRKAKEPSFVPENEHLRIQKKAAIHIHSIKVDITSRQLCPE